MALSITGRRWPLLLSVTAVAGLGLGGAALAQAGRRHTFPDGVDDPHAVAVRDHLWKRHRATAQSGA